MYLDDGETLERLKAFRPNESVREETVGRLFKYMVAKWATYGRGFGTDASLTVLENTAIGWSASAGITESSTYACILENGGNFARARSTALLIFAGDKLTSATAFRYEENAPEVHSLSGRGTASTFDGHDAVDVALRILDNNKFPA